MAIEVLTHEADRIQHKAEPHHAPAQAEWLTGPRCDAYINHAIDAIGSYPGRALAYAVIAEFPEDTDRITKLARKMIALQGGDPEGTPNSRAYGILRDYSQRVLEPSGLVTAQTRHSPQHGKHVITGHTANPEWSPFALPVVGAMIDWQLQFPYLDLKVLGDYHPKFSPGMPSTATNIFSFILKSPENYTSLDELKTSIDRPKNTIHRTLRTLEAAGIIMRTSQLDPSKSRIAPDSTKKFDSGIRYQINSHCGPAIADLVLRIRLLKEEPGFRQAAHERLRQVLQTPSDLAYLLSRANPRLVSRETVRSTSVHDIQRRKLGSLTLQCIPIEPQWRNQRMCDDDDLELFFPPGTKGPSAEQADDAKALCNMCDVQASCLQWSIDTHQRAGIFGGMDPEDRRRYRGKPHAPQVSATTPHAVTNDELTEILT